MSAIRVRLGSRIKPVAPYSRIPYRKSLHWRPNGERKNRAPAAVDVFMTQKAYEDVCTQAASDLRNEVGGWLVGKHRQDKISGRGFVVIETVLLAENTRFGSAFLTFTQASMVALNRTLETHFPQKILVGWFHTHPRMGVFFSEWDRWLHMNFFPEPWHVGLVIEPITQTGGFFIQKRNGNLDVRSYYGFYELTNLTNLSVVRWQNLIPEATQLYAQGGSK
jgi:proteasome lid subunit RPN8/RPN11